MQNKRNGANGCRRHAITGRRDNIVTVAFPGRPAELDGEDLLSEIYDLIDRGLPKLAVDDPARPSLEEALRAAGPPSIRTLARRLRGDHPEGRA